MKRASIKLPQEAWGSTVTKYSNNSTKVAADDFTLGTKNVDTYLRGLIAKRESPTNYGQATGPLKDQYEAIFSDGTHHLLVVGNGTLQYSSGAGDFTDVVNTLSPIGNMEFASYADRVYMGNGIDNPQVYDRQANYGGAPTVSVPQLNEMGVKPPIVAPTTALAADSTVDQIPAGAHTWAVTFLYYDFEESNGGPASSPSLTTDATHTSVNLANVPLGGYGVTARKIYRDDADGLLRLVGVIEDNVTTTFTDKASIGTSIIPFDNGAPRNFSLIVQHKDRMWTAGIPGDPSDLEFSEAGQPDIVRSTNTILCNPSDPITGLAVYNDRVVVFNKNSFGQIFGTTSDSFRYAEVPGNIGCVDNRTIQVRTLQGVPVLLWLSAKGFYAFNGSTVEYISDDIEDQLKFNIQQANQVKGSNSQSTQGDFVTGTPSPGIDLNVLPGSITTKGQLLNGTPTNEPTEVFDTQAEWEDVSASSVLVTRLPSLTNRIASPADTRVDAVNSVLSGLTASNVTDFAIPAFPTDYTGENVSGPRDTDIPAINVPGSAGAVAWKIILPRATHLTGFQTTIASFAYRAAMRFVVYADAGGAPGAQLYLSPTTTDTPVTGGTTVSVVTFSDVVALVAGSYWIGVYKNYGQIVLPRANFSGGAVKAWNSVGGVWYDPPDYAATVSPRNKILSAYQDAVSQSGTFISPVFDKGFLPSAQTVSVTTSSYTPTVPSYPASSILYLDQADDAAMSVGLDTQTDSSGSPTRSFSFSATKRYWRLRGAISTLDDRIPAILSAQAIVFPDATVWTSRPLDCSSDVTAYDAVSEVSHVATGGTVQLDVATSADNVTYTTFGPIVSAVVQRYIKFRYTLVSSSDGTDASWVSSLTFSYRLSSNWVSQPIDLGVTPEGWDIAQVSSHTNGGVLSYELRTAPMSGGLSSATYYPITSGLFPSAVPLNRWAQWRVSFQSWASHVPTVDSLTLRWFIKLTNSIRAASIFYARTYYVSLAEYNSPINNVVFVFDANGKWRVYRELNASTFSFFFQDPYIGDAVDAKVKKLVGGTSVVTELDVRTKAFDFGDMSKLKVIRQAYLVLENTGATFSASYSTDQGKTFHPLIDAAGASTWTVPEDGGITDKRLVPDWSSPGAVAGKTVLLRVQENTAKQVGIQEMRMDTFVREGDIING